MRSVIGNLLVVIVFLASIGLAQKSAGEQPGMVEGRVVRVIDGDTINVERTDRSVVVVKLQGIDAPEEKQPFGKRSRKNLEEILIGKDVNVVVHKKDQGGGYIGTVFLAGRDVGLLQVEWGMAWHYKQFGYEQSPDSRKRYAQAEEKARTDRLGLWEKGDAVPPWDFRGEHRSPQGAASETAARKPVVPAAVSPEAGAGAGAAERKYILGPRGGCYYLSDSGRKVYVKDKALCADSRTGTKQ